MILESMLDSGAKDDKIAPNSAWRSFTPRRIAGAEVRSELRHCASGEELRQRRGGIGDSSRRPHLGRALAHVIRQNVRYERFSGITWAGALCPSPEELGERDFSFCASAVPVERSRLRPPSVQQM